MSRFTAGRGIIDLKLGTDKLRSGTPRVNAMMAGIKVGAKAAAVAIAAIGTASALVTRRALTTFGAFEQTMARVKALSGATGDEFGALSDKARDLGERTMFSASQAAEAMAFFALAGFKVNEILGAMEPTLNLAAAGQLDMATAADITAKSMRGMGLDTDELASVVDSLTVAMTKSNNDLVSLGEAMKYAAPNARMLGVEIEELLALMMALGNAGIQGSMAGTQLSMVLARMASQTPQGAKAMRKLNLEFKDADGNLRNVRDILEDVTKATAGMGKAERVGVLEQIFPQRAGRALGVLLMTGRKDLDRFYGQIKGGGGTASRIAQTQMDTLQGAFTELKSAMESAFIDAGEAIKAPFEDLADVLRDNKNAIRDLLVVLAKMGGYAGDAAADVESLAAAGGDVARATGSVGGFLGKVYGKKIVDALAWGELRPGTMREAASVRGGIARQNVLNEEMEANMRAATARAAAEGRTGAAGILRATETGEPFELARRRVELEGMRGRGAVARVRAADLMVPSRAQAAPALGGGGGGATIALQEGWRMLQAAAFKTKSPEAKAAEAQVEQQKMTNDLLGAVVKNTAAEGMATIGA